MSRLFNWIKTHKLIVILIIIIAFMWFRENRYNPIPYATKTMMYGESDVMTTSAGMPALGGIAMERSSAPVSDFYEAAPNANIADRMVVRNSHLSLKVSNVSEALSQITSHVKTAGGYMVDSSVSNPDENASGSITVRVPETKLDETLAYFRSLSMKVVSENLSGTDVTDQYQDIDERLRILETNKARMEEIMTQASEISDITQIQQQIFSIQSQIESLKGQQQYLEQTSKLSLVTIYLATDELSLPYAPEQPWRPQVVFQRAVRSLLTNMQDFGSFIIWLGVYSVIIVPVGLIVWLIYRRLNKKSSPAPSSRNVTN